MEEISEGAGLYFDPANVDDIADKLMRIYKDEDGRKLSIEKGLIVAQQYNCKRTADAVWEAIIQTAH